MSDHTLGDNVAVHHTSTIEVRQNGYCISDTYENRKEIEKRLNMHNELVKELESLAAIAKGAMEELNANGGSYEIDHVLSASKALLIKAAK